MSNINHYSEASSVGIMSQFVPEQIPTELILNQLKEKQNIQDMGMAQAVQFGDFDMPTVYERDKQYVKNVKQEVNQFVDKAMNMDFTNPENRVELLRFRKKLMGDENLKTIMNNNARYAEYVKQKQKIETEGGNGTFFDIQLAMRNHMMNEYNKTKDGTVDNVDLGNLTKDLDRVGAKAKYFDKLGFNKYLAEQGIQHNFGNLDVDVLYQKSVKENSQQLKSAIEQYMSSYASTPEGKQDRAIYEYNKQMGVYDSVKDSKGNKVDYSFQNYLLDTSGAGKYQISEIDNKTTVLRGAATNSKLRKEEEDKNKLIVGQAVTGQDYYDILKNDLNNSDPKIRKNAELEMARIKEELISKMPESEKAILKDYKEKYNKRLSSELTKAQNYLNRINSGENVEFTKEDIKFFGANIGEMGSAESLSFGNFSKLDNNSKAQVLKDFIKKSNEVQLKNKNSNFFEGHITFKNYLVDRVPAIYDNRKGISLNEDKYNPFDLNKKEIHDINFNKFNESLNNKLKGTTVKLDNVYGVEDPKLANTLKGKIKNNFSSLLSVGKFDDEESKNQVENAFTNGKVENVKLKTNKDGYDELYFNVLPTKDGEVSKPYRFIINNQNESNMPTNETVRNMQQIIYESYGKMGKDWYETYRQKGYTASSTVNKADYNNVNYFVKNELNVNYSNKIGAVEFNGINKNGIFKSVFTPLSGNDMDAMINFKKNNGTFVKGKDEAETINMNKNILIGDAMNMLTPQEFKDYYTINDNREVFETLKTQAIKQFNSLPSSGNVLSSDDTKRKLSNDLDEYIFNNNSKITGNDAYKEAFGKVLDIYKKSSFPTNTDFLKFISSNSFFESRILQKK
jgi:hypothetical protein